MIWELSCKLVIVCYTNTDTSAAVLHTRVARARLVSKDSYMGLYASARLSAFLCVWRQAAGLLMTTALYATMTKQTLFSMAATCLQTSKSKYQSWQIGLCVCLAQRDRTHIWPRACSWRNWAFVVQWDSLKRGQISALSSKAQCECPV